MGPNKYMAISNYSAIRNGKSHQRPESQFQAKFDYLSLRIRAMQQLLLFGGIPASVVEGQICLFCNHSHL